MKKITEKRLFNLLSSKALMPLVVFFYLIALPVQGWAGASTTMRTISSNTGDGLVYMTKTINANPALNAYKPKSDDVSQSTSSGGVATFYAWAKPVRGKKFRTWADLNGNYTANSWPDHNSNSTIKLNTDHDHWDGVNDTIQGGNGGQASTDFSIYAFFEQEDGYDITYAIPAGGSYSVEYKYIILNSSSQLEETSKTLNLSPAIEESILETSYAADKITFTVPNEATNFIGWYEGESKISGTKTYVYTAHADVTIRPMFKELAWGDITGDVSVNVTAKGTYGSKTVYVAIPTLIGTWSSSEFEVAPTNTSNDFGSIHIDAVELNQTENRLEITYTYTASDWGGLEETFTITPTFGESKQFSVACFAEEVVGYEACIEESGERTHTGSLAEMMLQANSMTSKPTVKLMKDMTITTPLSFVKSMTFDANGKVLTANCVSAFSIDAADVDVQIIDGSFTQVGEIHTSYASANPVSVVTFTKAAKLTMQGGTLSAENTGAGAAYGIDVQQGSVFYMTGGDMTVIAPTDAQGVHVASSDDYATLNGGSIVVSAPASAYGLWSAGQSNITDATIDVTATTGASAYGVYIHGGTTTVTTTNFAVDAKTTNAYGANVNAGRLNFNGGELNVSAEISDVYGVYVANGATAMLQQNAKVTAETTGASGTNVIGINNLGTVTLNNISVTATSATNYATAVNSISSAVSTTIEGGTYTANTETGYAYGLHHQYGSLNVDGGTFKGIVKTSGANAYGVCVVDNATIANATMLGETRGSGNTAYGFVGGVANKTITLTNCDITGKSNTNKAYAIYSRTNVSASGCTLTATTLGSDQAYGVYAENGTNGLANCNVTVTANSVKAYGVNHVAGAMTINGGTFAVSAKQITADAAQNSELYGLYNAASQTTNVTNATFTVSASNAAYSQNVYGAYINGTLNSTGATYAVQAKLNVYGVWGNTASNLNLKNNTISSTATNGTKSYGIYAKKNFTIDGDVINAQASTTDIYAMYFDASSVGEVKDGKFSAESGNPTNGYGPINANGTVGNVKLKGGVAKTAANLMKYAYTGYNVYTLDDTHPDYADGYRYTIATENPSPYVCYIKNGNKYETLAAALQYTKDNSGSFTIVMSQNHTLPAGNYELPSNATLIIPQNINQNTLNTSVPKDDVPSVEMIEEHLRLTLASGVNLNVNGKIEVGGKLYSQESGKISYNNNPYSRIYMESGSLIQLNSGAKLYAWGYISGNGEIKAKNGSEVHEMFQLGDMKAISPLGQHYMGNKAKFFPVQTYSIQNIEVPTTYYYNSQLITAMYEYNPGSIAHGYNGEENIKLIGKQDALFLVTDDDESSWVRKSYVGGKQIYEINSSAKLGSLKIDVGSYSMNSQDYILPITSTMKIHILDGIMEITQNTMFQPGTQMEINKTATLKINSDVSVYVLDQDQWLNTSNPDAAWNIHGNVSVYGKLYTSTTDGANIYSNNADAGTISFSSSASSATTIKLMTSADATKEINMDPAKLKNGDGTYTTTAGAVKDHSFVYMNNAWAETYDDGCFKVIDATYYANPSEYVALNNGKTANDDHTYTTVEDKLLICQSNCQWWEVEATATDGVFECKKEGYEGFYSYNEGAGEWQLVKRNVTFYMDEAKTEATKKVVSVNYMGIPDQSVIATNPTKAQTAEYTYTFYGWKSSVTEAEYAWTATLEAAENDMSYTPVFTATKRKYTVTLRNANNGADVPVETPYGELPSYTPTKAATAQYTYTFTSWSPAFVAVTGPATYTATWDAVVNLYTITWKDGDNTLQTDKNQAFGKVTAFNGTLPTKEADDEFVYTFDGWVSSQNGTTYANGSTPTVSGDVTYTAHYATTPRYMITFVNYDGEELQKSAVTQGTAPVFNGTPRRDPDRDGYFRFTGWKNSNGETSAAGATLPTATKKETYTAQFEYITTVYTITFKNFDGNDGEWSNRFGEEETPSYDGTTPLGKAATTDKEYTLDYWLAASNSGHYTAPLPAVTKAEIYTAVWAESARQYTITWVDGNGNTLKEEQVAYGTTPAYTGATPTKDATDIKEYTFNSSWSPTVVAVNGDATYTAQFEESDRKYEITWMDGNSDIIYVDRVPAGVTPAYDENTHDVPTKTSTTIYNYTFNNTWSPAIVDVTGDAVYRAQFDATEILYTITFKDEDGTELKTLLLHYDDQPTCEQPARDNTDLKTYIFNGWKLNDEGTASKTIPTVTTDATYWANFTVQNNVAKVGSMPYQTWDAAYNAVSDNGTITLLTDIDFGTNKKTIQRTITLDLNGCTISGNVNQMITIESTSAAKTLTITDSKGDGCIKVIGNNQTAVYASRTSSGWGMWPTYYYGSIVVNAGGIIGTGTGSSIGKYDNSNSITVNGGYFSHNTNISAASGKTLLTLADNHPKYNEGYRYVVETAHSITWEENGGTIPISPAYTSGDVASGTPITAPATPTRTGYTFAGWTPDVAGVMPTDANLTYTATWTANTYTIEYNGNGHTGGSTTSSSHTYDVAKTLTTNGFTKTGYTFAGWATSAGGEVAYDNGASVTNLSATQGATVTLYAQWTPITYTIRFEGNGATGGTMANQKFTYDVAQSLTSNAFVKAAFEFIGWNTADDGSGEGYDDGQPVSNLSDTQDDNINFYAQWRSVRDDNELDIVEWTSDTIVINMNGASQSVTIGGTMKSKTDRATNRTMVFAVSGLTPDAYLTITGSKSQSYRVPHIIDSDATLTTLDSAKSVIRVNAGTLTITGNVHVNKVYVNPGAELVVAETGTLTCNQLILRTTPWKAASIVGNYTTFTPKDGEYKASHTYYTRIIDKQDAYYHFGLPLACNIDEVFLSKETNIPYGSTWILKSYNGADRAKEGPGNSNWDYLEGDTPETKIIQANVGYEMFSNSKYYREFYFPVNPAELATSITAKAHSSDNPQNQGWNALVAPTMHRWDILFDFPEDAKKISELIDINVYWQHTATNMQPALPFYYQNMGDTAETLTFSVPQSLAPRRMAEENTVQTQWLQVNYTNTAGQKDETNIYVHPTKFTTDFEPQYDVYKITKSGSRPLIYTQLDCGDLAFAAIPDNAQLQMLPLAVFSPVAGEYTFSLVHNRFLTRMANVWIFDSQTAAIIDLLQSNYTVSVEQGTTASRFYLMGKFRAPQVTTDLENIDGGEDSDNVSAETPRKIIYDEHLYILYKGRIWDANGKLIK